MTTSVVDLLASHVERGTMPGAVAVLGPADDEPEPVAVGAVAIGGPPMAADALMRIQSMTKAITSVAALRLVADGRLGLDDGLEPWLPELADRRVLTAPTGKLSDTVPASRSITLRHLLTNTAGYGMIPVPSPLQHAMAENATEAGPDPVSLGADEWLARLAELPLAFQPGEGWRYHHSFAVLGILLSRVTGRPTGDHLREDLLGPLEMVDTAFWAPADQAHRLPAAYRHGDSGLEELEPAGGGFYAGPPPFDVSHAELVSTASDYLAFLRMLTHRGIAQTGDARGERLLREDLATAMVRDQTPAAAKSADSFFSPTFWDEMGWGYGVGIEADGEHAGRFTWSGGLGTNFFVDPDGTIGILLTQVELGDRTMALVTEFQALRG
ncbi:MULTISPECIES: serine hydrolase domain-containing protein [Microbacterium]|uniref:serine hydrolase domain-containing protein n=1 Tax=Microbacterium TaxID=33882 RepID=UPI000D64D44B|nr:MULTISPECIES: serine hydrolase domain-containing protein [Microbacterium]